MHDENIQQRDREWMATLVNSLSSCFPLTLYEGIFAGFMISPNNMPSGWRFLYWAMPGHYAFVSSQYQSCPFFLLL